MSITSLSSVEKQAESVFLSADDNGAFFIASKLFFENLILYLVSTLPIAQGAQ